jgi:small-conductance mechanosensitive channel
MDFAKYVFIIVASITVFGILGGLDPTNSIAEMAFKALVTGLIFATGLVLREVKTLLLSKI